YRITIDATTGTVNYKLSNGTTGTLTATTDYSDYIDAIKKIVALDPALKEIVEVHNYNGNFVLETLDSIPGSSFVSKLEYDNDSTDSTAAVSINKSSSLSINSGADAEFISMINRLDQTASRTELQLRLDNLGISDSAFGDFSVDSTGLITMKQDGVEFAVGQLSIAMFNNERGLKSEGNNLMSKTSDSGNPIYNINNDKAATVAGKALELSTADLSESLVNLMVFQRAFEANSKSITTSDQILTTLIQLKK
ncbi:MAG: flagellar hook-basal body complex protein, partial [Campylobacterales bacterium]|nr:flagellar hook-basal body complex protein [Campylobacterales bacterium]